MKKTFWIVNRANNSDTAEIYLYGAIGYYDSITADSFVKELNGLVKDGYKNINIRVNCVGGSVYDGFAIFNAIKNCKANIEIYIDGIAASMGTVVAASGRKCYMSRVAQYMTHRVTGGCWGNADEMQKMAEVLIQLENSICAIYAERTGLTVEECRTKYLTNQDRWLTAQEALDEKLIDGIYDAEDVAAPENIADEAVRCEFYNSQLLPALNEVLNQNSDMKKIPLPISEVLLTQLGLAANATEEAIANAVITSLTNSASLQQTVATLTQQNTSLQAKVDGYEKDGAKNEVTTVLAKAVEEKLMTQETADVYAANFPENPEAVKKIVATLKPYQPVTDQLPNGGNPTNESDTALAEEFDKLDMEGKTEALAKNDWDRYSRLYKAKFNKEPKKAA